MSALIPRADISGQMKEKLGLEELQNERPYPTRQYKWSKEAEIDAEIEEERV